MKKFSRFAALFVLLASFSKPFLAAAQSVSSSGGAGSVNQEWIIYYKDLIVWAVNSILVPVLFAVAFAVFLWGVYKYFIYGADNETERETGKKFVLWGVIGFVIISSVWGLVNVVKQTLIPSTAGSTHPNYPTL